MSVDFSSLRLLGWSNFFSIQIPLDRLEAVRVARVVRVERGNFRVDLGSEQQLVTLAGRLSHAPDAGDEITIGDWVLLAPDAPVIVERLERRTVIRRRAAGAMESQPLAANVDVMLVVGGLDAEFNLHRIERYLVLAAQAGVTPVVVLTKADLAERVEPLVEQVRKRLPAEAEVVAVNALRDPLSERLAPWLGPGTTLVVVGSSGVGKSTLVNNLAGTQLQATGATGAESKGRHTTTSRSLIRLPGGACIIDVPGLREVGLIAEGGVERQFATIAKLSAGCRFSDCTHQSEPGCAVREAVDKGELDNDLWVHYLKLMAEERHNITEQERRRRARVFGKMVHRVVAAKKRERGE